MRPPAGTCTASCSPRASATTWPGSSTPSCCGRTGRSFAARWTPGCGTTASTGSRSGTPPARTPRPGDRVAAADSLADRAAVPEGGTMTEFTAAQSAQAGRAGGQIQRGNKWWTLVAVCLGTFMLLLDITIVNVALPDIQRALNSTFAD